MKQLQLFNQALCDVIVKKIEMSDVYWLAGLLEGEGCFKSSGNGVSIILGMTDLDIVKRAAHILNANIQNPRASTPIGRKEMHYCQVNSDSAVIWMMILYPYMGIRRKEAINKALEKWKTLPGKGGWNKGIFKNVKAKCQIEGTWHMDYVKIVIKIIIENKKRVKHGISSHFKSIPRTDDSTF